MDILLLHADIVWPAFLAGLLVLLTHIPMGREVLQRGIIFLDLAIAQMAALGVVLANTLWLHNENSLAQTLIATTTAAISAMGLYALRHLAVKVQEAIIGIVFVLAATAILLLLSQDPHGGEQLKTTLAGQILWIQGKDLIPIALTYGAILITWLKCQNTLGAWLFYPFFALTITLSTQLVGIYLVFASLIIPNLATLNQRNPKRKAFLLGTLGYSSGLLASSFFDLPAGPAIVWCLALIALLYFAYRLLQYKYSSPSTHPPSSIHKEETQ